MDRQIPAAQVLMKRSRKGAAQLVHLECSNILNSNSMGIPTVLDDLLNILLNPRKNIDWETIDWCKWLMAGGRTPDEFSDLVKKYDNATICGLVWTANFVAYRCRTCGISPCMSLCADCFQHGNHDGHDYNMFRSQAGGACDCGDTSVMKPNGFCSRHGPSAQVNPNSAPHDLMCVAAAIMPRIILRLIQHLRENNLPRFGPNSGPLNDADPFLTMLHDLSAMGAAMRSVISDVLTDPQIYHMLTNPSAPSDSKTCDKTYKMDSQRWYNEAVANLPNPPPLVEFYVCPALTEILCHKTFLEELVFWTVKFEFPQKIVCLLLDMLPNPGYKESLIRAFVLHYSRISMMLEESTDTDMLSNRVVHVSVQLFSNEDLAFKMTEDMKLLHVMVISLTYMVKGAMIFSPLNGLLGCHYVVDCAQQVMREHCYWPLVSDLNNVLSHKPVAVKFMTDLDLMEQWFCFLSSFQGMNVNVRELTQHIEFEPNTYYAAFSAELEASAYPMWALLSHLWDSSTIELTKNVLTCCLNMLEKWIRGTTILESKEEKDLKVSFHLPLHRYFSLFLCQAVNMQGVPLREVLPSTDSLARLMLHPLQVQATFYEILNGLWVRNGLQIRGQAMTYIQCNFCNSMVDADIYLLQVCFSQMDPKLVMKNVVNSFSIIKWLSFLPITTMGLSDNDTNMVESCLIYLTSIICLRTNMGVNLNYLSQLEMVTLLCMGDKTHSQLIELFPERVGNAQSRDLDTVLAEVADYRAPNLEASGNMQQGMYVPKPEVWETIYDPIHVLLRAVHRRDFQSSLDRFTEHLHLRNKFPNNKSPWPPYRYPVPGNPAYGDLRRVLSTRLFHAIVWIILYKAVSNIHSVTDHILSLIIFLMEMAVVSADNSDETKQALSVTNANTGRKVRDGLLSTWYDSDWLSSNLRTRIHSVLFFPGKETSPVIDSSPDSDNETQYKYSPQRGFRDHQMIHTGGEAVPALCEAPTQDGITNAVALTSRVNPASSTIHPAIEAPATRASLPPPSQQFALTSSDNALMNLPSTSGTVCMTQMHVDESTSIGDVTAHIITDLVGSNDGVTGELVVANPFDHLAEDLVVDDGDEDGNNELVVSNAVANETSDYDMYDEDAAENPQLPPSQTLIAIESAPETNPAREVVLAGGNYSQQYPWLQNPPNTRPHPEGLFTNNESIISLLLRLHSMLSGFPDSFNPDEVEADPESRIGDGPMFVGKLLRKIMALDTFCKEEVYKARECIWRNKKVDEEKKRLEKEETERLERRRKARERQQKVMEEFASQQKQFMMKTMQKEGGSMDWENLDEEVPTLNNAREYDCVICGQTSPSTEEKLMGLVVLVQSTSVLGHKRKSAEAYVLPTSDTELRSHQRYDLLGVHHDRRISEMERHFDPESWQLALNLGWEGGVHAQTCGHHLHLDCLKAYLKSLLSAQRLSVERGEYACPLCRQLSNSVLPLPPQLGDNAAIVRSRPVSLPSSIIEIGKLLKELCSSKQPKSNLTDAMSKALEDMSSTTDKKYKFRGNMAEDNKHSMFLFVSSIARTNLEIELVQRGGTLCSAAVAVDNLSSIKRSCFLPLLHVLADQCRTLAEWPACLLWEQLTGVNLIDPSETPLALVNKLPKVPLMLHDPIALLIQLILLLPLNLEQTYFTTIVKLVYNLLYFQVTLQLTCLMKESERNWWRSKDPSFPFYTLDSALSETITLFDQTNIYAEDSNEGDMETVPDKLQVELTVQKLCLPFLRIAALLRHHLYEQELPEINSNESEFVRLVYYLELVSEGMDWERFNASVALSWLPSSNVHLKEWVSGLGEFVGRSLPIARSLMTEMHVVWHQPRLLSLPELYGRIFQFYHRKPCLQCQSVPRETSICLLCGTLVCLKETCCKHNLICEAVQHSIDCGGGTGMFLVVTSSYVIVIRGNRACLWGSVYLDSFGEEDRELKRGKPLYLSESRYNLLQQQWLSHRFDHTNKKWVWHRDSL